MKVITSFERNVYSDYDRDTRITIALETEEGLATFSVGCGEPEDMTLDRDLSGCYSVPEMLRAAHAAGKRGEPYEEVVE